MKRLLAFVLAAVTLLLVAGPARADDKIVLWHAYRGDEEVALKELAGTYQSQHAGVTIELLAIPHEAFSTKLGAAIPHAHGPDLFIDAHERLGFYRKDGLVAPIDDALPDADYDTYDDGAIEALSVGSTRYAVPLALKALALYVNEALLQVTPKTLEELAALRSTLPPGTYALAYDTTSAFFHAPFLHAYGGRMLDEQEHFAFFGDKAARSLLFVRGLVTSHVIPEEPSGALIKQLFATGHIAAVINGPWFASELKEDDPEGKLKFRVDPLPAIAEAGGVMRPFLTVEGVFRTPSATPASLAFARFLGGSEAAVHRARVGRQTVATKSAWNEPHVASDRLLSALRVASRGAVLMPTSVAMRAAWVPSNQAILKAVRGDAEPAQALLEAKHRYEDVSRPAPPARSPALGLLGVGVGLLAAAYFAVRRARSPAFASELRASLPAYRYVTHAVIAVGVLVVLPLVAGALTSFFAGTRDEPRYVGIANYVAILTARGGDLLGHGSFYLTLIVTVVWTVLNVSLHVTFGLVLGAALSRPWLRLRAVYRVLLILPWAVPSYVTALAWKGMYNRQFGAVNAFLKLLGVEPVSWFSHFSTAFAANICTNVWLGFPFMMVVTLGALTSIPKDVLEAAEVDGATRWQRFRLVTLPLLRPALLPAVLLGAVWTFNMFNVVFLVSGGEPDGTTDILVSEAYRWAFTRDAQYGYAAAYAVLIFFLLAAGSRATAKGLGSAEESAA